MTDRLELYYTNWSCWTASLHAFWQMNDAQTKDPDNPQRKVYSAQFWKNMVKVWSVDMVNPKGPGWVAQVFAGVCWCADMLWKCQASGVVMEQWSAKSSQFLRKLGLLWESLFTWLGQLRSFCFPLLWGFTGDRYNRLVHVRKGWNTLKSTSLNTSKGSISKITRCNQQFWPIIINTLISLAI